MKEKEYLSSGEVAKALGVSVKTVQRWDQAGLLTVVRTIHNQRRIPASEITRLTRGIGQPRCVIYARVSTSRQEQAGNLERQADRLRQVANTRGYLLTIVTVFSGRMYGHRAKRAQECMTSRIKACLQ